MLRSAIFYLNAIYGIEKQGSNYDKNLGKHPIYKAVKCHVCIWKYKLMRLINIKNLRSADFNNVNTG